MPNAPARIAQWVDCAVVETQCCDHCNGGKAKAYNVKVAADHKAKNCGSTACTEMACGEAIGVCKAGRCDVAIRPIGPPPS